LLVKTKRLSVPESVAQKRRLLPQPLRYTKAERRLAANRKANKKKAENEERVKRCRAH